MVDVHWWRQLSKKEVKLRLVPLFSSHVIVTTDVIPWCTLFVSTWVDRPRKYRCCVVLHDAEWMLYDSYVLREYVRIKANSSIKRNLEKKNLVPNVCIMHVYLSKLQSNEENYFRFNSGFTLSSKCVPPVFAFFFLFFFVKAISQHGIARWSARVNVARGDRFIGLSAELSLAIVCACVPGTQRRAASKAQHLNYHQIACDQDNRKLTGCHTHTTEHLF